MNENVKVSIVLATYRRDKELIRALNSLITLNYKNFEVILVDDNDDEEWNKKVCNILDEFKENNSTIDISYIANHPNKGSAKARNEGIKKSTGEYICFLDDDDIYLPARINNQLFPMIENDADYSITDLALYDEHDKLVEKRNRTYITETSKDHLLKYHFLYHMTGTDCLMFKKDYLFNIGMFDPIDVGDEFYLMTKAIDNNGKFIYVPVCDVKAYIHTGTIGLSNGEGKILGENSLFEYKKQFFDRLSKNQVNYIKTRHFIVLAYAYLKMKSFFKCFVNLIKAFFISPKHFLNVWKMHRIK